MFKRIHTALALTIVVLVGMFCSLGTVLWVLLGFRPKKIDFWIVNFNHLSLAVLGVKVKSVVRATPAETLPKQLVIVCNHESHLDGPSIATSLRDRCIRYVAKEQLFNIPIWGWAMRASGNVALTRGDSQRDRESLNKNQLVGRDVDILFFAEGTRSLDGQLHPFKKGAFVFAIQHQIPILPIAVGGGYDIIPPHTVTPQKGQIVLAVGEPIAVAGLSYDDRDALANQTFQQVQKLREECLRLAGSPRAKANPSSSG